MKCVQVKTVRVKGVEVPVYASEARSFDVAICGKFLLNGVLLGITFLGLGLATWINLG